MPDQQHDAGALRRRDHGLALIDRDRHRLFGQHVLVRGERQRGVLRMQLGRRRDIHRVKRGARQHRRQVGEALGTGLARDALARLGHRFRHSRQLERRMAADRRQERAPRRAQPRDADANPRRHWFCKPSLVLACSKE